MQLSVRGIPSEAVERLRRGRPGANGQPALVRIADGPANPCRHCLGLIAPGEEKQVLAYRPFPALQPHAELGPIPARARARATTRSACRPGSTSWPPRSSAATGPTTGSATRPAPSSAGPRSPAHAGACRRILADPTVAYVHDRSNLNCSLCRVDRGR